MMLVYSLVGLSIASIAAYLGGKTNEEIIKLGAIIVATVCVLVSLVLAPMGLKLFMLFPIFVSKKLI